MVRSNSTAGRQLGVAVWLWAFLFARVPLAAIQHLGGPDSRPFVLINLITLALGGYGFWREGWRPLDRLRQPLAAAGVAALVMFWAIYGGRLIWDQWLSPTELVIGAPELLKMLVNSTLIPVIALPWVLPRRLSLRVLDGSVLLGNLSLAFGLLVFVFRTGEARTYFTRFGFSDLNPIPAGHSSASLVICSVILLLVGSRTRGPLHLGTWCNGLFGLLLGLAGIQFSLTRSALLALLPMVLVVLWYLLRWRGISRWLVLSAFVPLAAVLLPRLQAVLQRGVPADASVSGRLIRFQACWDVIRQHPLAGLGFQSQRLLEQLPEPAKNWYPHNLVLESLMIGGVVLFLLLVIFTGTVLWTGLQLFGVSAPDGATAQAFTLLWLQGLIHALFSGHLAMLPAFWVGGLLVLYARRPDDIAALQHGVA
jgi:O-antigen ligase